MKRTKKIIIFSLLVCIFTSIYSAALVISQAGEYSLGSNITYTPATTDRIIYITTSNVSLNLNNFNLIQSGGAGTLNGIEIASGLSNITITNGSIQGVSGTGILVNSGCRNIVIENIETYTANQGIALSGTSANNISNCVINNIVLRYITAQAISISSSSLVTLDNFVIDTSSTTTVAIQCICPSSQYLSTLSLNNITINNCANGIQINNYHDVKLNECTIYNCTTTSSFLGFNIAGLSTSSKNITIQNSMVAQCSSTASNFKGFAYTKVTDSAISQCKVQNCSHTGTFGRSFHTEASQNVSIDRCLAQNVTTSNVSPSLNGFEFNGVQYSSITNSEANLATAGSTQGGFVLSTGFGCVIQSCINNRSANSASGFVINQSSSECIIDKCICSSVADAGFSCLFTSTNNLFNQCQATNCNTGFDIQSSYNIFTYCTAQNSTAGFSILAGITNISIKNCIAQGCTNGFSNASGLSNSIESCVASNNSNTGFLQSVALGTNRYFNNVASRNTTANYSAAVNNQLAAGTSPVTAGANNNG